MPRRRTNTEWPSTAALEQFDKVWKKRLANARKRLKAAPTMAEAIERNRELQRLKKQRDEDRRRLYGMKSNRGTSGTGIAARRNKGKKLKSMRGKSQLARKMRRSGARLARQRRAGEAGQWSTGWIRKQKKTRRKAKQSVGTRRRSNPDTINDRRSSKHKPWGFVVFTDKFMSGWGGASGGRSLYALAVDSPGEADIVLANGKRRSEMKRGRLVDATSKGLPKIKLGARDHLSITDRGNAERWYTRGGF